MEERNRERNAVLGAQTLPLSNEEAVVDDVAVGQHDTLGEARRATGVLHHDDVVVVELFLGLAQGVVGHVGAQQDELGHAVAATVLLGPHVDDALEHGIGLGLEAPALLREGLGHEFANDLEVVDVSERVNHAKGLHVGLLQDVVQLVALVDRVHGDHDHADLGRCVHERQPIGDVARPDAQMVTGLEADGQKALGKLVGAPVEVGVGPTQVAVGIDHELVVAVDDRLLAQVLADGQLGVKRVVGSTTRRQRLVLGPLVQGEVLGVGNGRDLLGNADALRVCGWVIA